MVANRKSSEWTPELPNTIEGLYGNMPSLDVIFFRVNNKAKTRQVVVWLKTDKAEQFAKDLLKTVKQVKKIQKRRTW